MIANVGFTIAALAIVTLDGPVWLVVIVDVLPIPYNVVVLVGVWRSAARWQGEPVWATLARLAIAIWFAVAIVF